MREGLDWEKGRSDGAGKVIRKHMVMVELRLSIAVQLALTY